MEKINIQLERFLEKLQLPVDNINLSWNKVTEKCLKWVWKNVWPELSKDVRIKESIVDVDEIVKLANETVLDIEKLLQVTTGADHLNELVEQQVHQDDEISFSEEDQQKVLSKKKLSHYDGNYRSVYTNWL